MININLSYDYILRLEILLENEILDISKKYRDLTNRYKQTCQCKADKQENKISFNTDYGITKEYYDTYTKSLQIRQYTRFLELEKLIKECKEQNNNHPYIGYSRGLKKELIRFNPSYDNVREDLKRLESV